jgi:arsenate reductase (glutaredoxin)
MIKIYHNPSCSKSRAGVAFLSESSHPFEVVEYMKGNLDKETLKELLKQLNYKAEDLIRKGEAIYKEKYKGKSLNDEEWIEAMLTYPKLIERPIISNGTNAIVARPTEKIKEIL